MANPLDAEYIEDIDSINKTQASSTTERRRALKWCLNNEWLGTDIDTLERVDDDTAGIYAWAMWKRA